MGNNNLNDEDARLIARALRCNTNLQYFALMENNFTEVGHNALGKAIYNPTSLNSMSDCNHTCRILVINWDEDIPNNTYSLKLNRARKIYHLLSVRNREESNVYHLNLEFGDDDEDDAALKLVPRVLESVYRHAEMYAYIFESPYVTPLSIIYEVLRGWKVPELYERR